MTTGNMKCVVLLRHIVTLLGLFLNTIISRQINGINLKNLFDNSNTSIYGRIDCPKFASTIVKFRDNFLERYAKYTDEIKCL